MVGAGSNLRVLRGGSFYFVEGSLRAALRDGRSPGYRIDVIGFRVVASRLRP